MNKTRKILFPSDFSDTAQNAFQHCLVVAEKLGAKILLLHAVYPEYETLDLPVMAAKATKDKVEAARVALKSFRDYGLAEIKKQGALERKPEIDINVEVGGPVGVITNIARRDEADLIVMGTKGEHDAVERALGSVTTGVVERASCPVMVVPEKADYKQIDTVAYATDLHEADPFHLWKATRLLEAFNPVLHIVHIDTGKDKEEKVDFSEMKELFSEHVPTLQIQFHNIRDTSVEKGLKEFVETYDIDLLVMFAPHHNLLERLFQQSNTRRMARKTHIPLLLLKTG